MSDEELVKEIQNGINVADNMEQLYCRSQSMINKIVKKYSYIEDAEDLRQESYFGLEEAAKRYKFDRGAKFTTYAEYWIVQAIRRYIDTSGSCVRIPSFIRSRIIRYKKYITRFLYENGKMPDKMQILKELDFSEKQLDEIQVYMLPVKSIDAEIKQEDDKESYTLLESLKDESVNVEEQVETAEYVTELKNAIDFASKKYLTDREQEIIRKFYFENVSLNDNSNQLGISKGRVYQIKDCALRKLGRNARKILNGYIDIETRAYNGSYQNFVDHGTSIVEWIAIRQQELEHLYKEVIRV